MAISTIIRTGCVIAYFQMSTLCGADALPSPYRALLAREGEQQVVVLRNPFGGFACIRPDMGNTCTSLTLAAPDGKPLELLTSGSANSGGTGLMNGIPIMFPWPGMLADGGFMMDGKPLQVFPGSRRNLMHGFSWRYAWNTLETGADSTAAWVTSRLTSADCRETSAGFPFTWSLTLTHRLTAARLEITAEIENTGAGTMPFGLGFHPWLRAPLDSSVAKEDCLVQIPALSIWAHDQFDSLGPTSHTVASVSEFKRRVLYDEDLWSPGPVGNRSTTVYSGLQASGGMIACNLLDAGSGRRIQLSFTENLGTVVLFNPRRRSAICIEPWSCPPNALNLFGKGLRGSGITLLQPGKTWRADLTFSLH